MQKPPSRVWVRRAFGKTLRRLRLRAGIAQEALALDAGIGRSYMGRLERGLSNPTIEMTLRLLPSLHVSFPEFAQEFDRNLRRG